MDREATDRSPASGKSSSASDRFEMVSKVVAIAGGLISAVVLIISLREGTNQRASELRWEQARLAAELEDDMLINDPQAFNALRLTDWGAFDFTIEGAKVRITRDEVHQALDVENNDDLSSSGVFIRESFDRLFYRMGKIERALQSDLIRFEDVCSPMDYYVPFLRSAHGRVLIPYMEQLHHTDALAFVKRFDAGPKCPSSEPGPGSS
jgi:hypothetical protein